MLTKSTNKRECERIRAPHFPREAPNNLKTRLQLDLEKYFLLIFRPPAKILDKNGIPAKEEIAANTVTNVNMLKNMNDPNSAQRKQSHYSALYQIHIGKP